MQVWRSQRQLSNPAFRKAAVASYGAAMSAGAARLVETWKARRHTGATDVFTDYNELVCKRRFSECRKHLEAQRPKGLLLPRWRVSLVHQHFCIRNGCFALMSKLVIGRCFAAAPSLASVVMVSSADVQTLRITTNVLVGDDLDTARASELVQAVARAFEYFARRSATGFVVPEWYAGLIRAFQTWDFCFVTCHDPPMSSLLINICARRPNTWSQPHPHSDPSANPGFVLPGPNLERCLPRSFQRCAAKRMGFSWLLQGSNAGQPAVPAVRADSGRCRVRHHRSAPRSPRSSKTGTGACGACSADGSVMSKPHAPDLDPDQC